MNEWGAALLRASVQGGVAILVVWALVRVFPRMPASFRCWLWRLAYVKLFVALFWVTPLDLKLLPRSAPPPRPTPPGASRIVPAAPAVVAPAAVQGLPPLASKVTVVRRGALSSTLVKSVAPPVREGFPLSGVLLTLWLLGSTACLARLLQGWLRTARLIRQSRPCVDMETVRASAALGWQMGVSRRPELLVSNRITAPMLAGVTTPSILVPEELLDREKRSDLRLMLAHELAHLKRNDLLWSWVPAVAHALLFFHPLLWLAHREWRLAQEIACDEAAILLTETAPGDYGRMLLSVAAGVPASMVTPRVAAVSALESHDVLASRLRAMKQARRASVLTVVLGPLAVSLTALLLVIPFRVVGPPPAGKLVFCASRSGDLEVYTADTDGSRQRQITSQAGPDWWPALSPDGSKIAFVKHRQNQDDIWVMDPDGGNQRQLTFGAAVETTPFWSPDGKKIVFNSNVSGSEDIWVMNADGSGARNLTPNSPPVDANPAWSPDGKRIAFGSQRNGPFEVFVMDADGGNVVNVSRSTGFDQLPGWSPDGKSLVFTSDRGGERDLWLLELETGKLRQLTRDAARDGMGRFSPDGSRILFHSNRDGGPTDFDLYTVSTDGSAVTRVIGAEGFDQMPHWVQ